MYSPLTLEGLSQVDMGLFELVHHMQTRALEPKKLDPAIAKQVAGFAKARGREAAKCRSSAGNDRPEVEARMALFDLEEIELGALLGVGGFSNVYEIKGFKPSTGNKNGGHARVQSTPPSSGSSSSSASGKTRHYSQQQRAAREFLAQHARRREEKSTDESMQFSSTFTLNPAATTSQAEEACECSDAMAKKGTEENGTTARYALKHLRQSLVRCPEKFAKAAMDLACEAEMMMCLDHPNIVKLRRWATDGPKGYTHGAHNSYFLIIDRLVETLEDRIWEWRT